MAATAMRRTLRIAGAVLALSLAAACSGNDDTGDAEPNTTREPVEDTTGQPGRDPEATRVLNYNVAYDLCANAGATRLAAELGGDASDLASVAEAYAEGTTEQYRAASREGCLDALTGQPRDPS